MDQTDLDWRRRGDLIDKLLDLTESDRPAFIEAIERESPQDATALRRWLASIERSTDFLEHPAPAIALGRGQELAGSWRVLSLIGRGGMGEVWLGERADGLFEKKVAIKFIRDDRPQLRDSIESERRMLAGLQHPGIVRLLDAGVTANGQAFLVTDYIEGITLNVWLTQQSPSLSRRLDLFRQVAAAVAYAHEKLVIHRDIKPANILVDKAERAHLLDFGIARALMNDDDAMQTTGAALTPDFAPPELITHNLASVRSDVYALGGLLYFLLCGHPPLRLNGLALAAAINRICHEPPMPPSLVTTQAAFALESKRLLADVDAIALKALSKNARDRYETVAGLLRDIDSALDNRPIEAKTPDAWDRLTRYARRNRIGIAIAAVVGLSLLVGMAGTLWQAHQARLQTMRAEREAERATHEAATANAVRDFLVGVFESQNPNEVPGKPPTSVELIDAAVRRIDVELPGRPDLQAQLLDTLGQAYQGLGKTEESIATLRHARAIAVAAQGDTSPLAERLTIDFARMIDNHTKDPAPYQEVVPLLKKIIEDPSVASDPTLYIAALDQYGSLEARQGDLAIAESTLRQAIEVARSNAPKADVGLADALSDLSVVAVQKGNTTETIALLEEALTIRLRLFNAHSSVVAATQRDLAIWLSKVGRMDEAATMIEHVVETDRAIYGETHAQYAMALTSLAIIRDNQGRQAEAATVLLEALEIVKKSMGSDSVPAMNVLNMLAVVKGHQKEPDQAIGYARAALAISTKLYGPQQPTVLIQRQNLAALEAMNGNYATAEAELHEILAALQRMGSTNTAPSMLWLGYVLRLRGDATSAEKIHEKLIAAAEADPTSKADLIVKGRAALAEDERDLTWFDRARKDAEIARDGFQSLQHNADSLEVHNMRYLLAQLDVLENHCSQSIEELEATWQRRKQLKDTEMNRWQIAEAALFVGLCREQMGRRDNAQYQQLIWSSAKEIRQSPLADAFVKALATRSLKTPKSESIRTTLN